MGYNITQTLNPDVKNARRLLYTIKNEYDETLKHLPSTCCTNILTKIMNTYVIPKLLANAPIYGLMLNMSGTMRRKATTILNGIQKYVGQINKIHNNTKTVLQNTSVLLQNAITTIIDPFLYSKKLAVQQLTTLMTRDDNHLNNWLYKYLHQSTHDRQSVIYDTLSPF